MYSKYLKLAIAIVLIGLGVWQITDANIGNGVFLILLAGIFVLLYFKNEFIILAFLQLRKQNLSGAQKWLGYIKNPKTALIKSQQAYYYFLQGLILSQTNINASEKLFKKALGLGLSMAHDRAMAKLNLAGIAISRRRKREATNLLNEAKKMDKHGMLSDQIKMMKMQMKKI